MSTYREAGVDVAAGDRFVSSIAADVASTWSDDVVGRFGGFAAGIRVPAGYRRPVLMMSTDGVGTKLEVARLAGRVEGLGFDVVAMCVDDLAAAGARPIAFTDYLVVERLAPDRDRAIVKGVAAACRAAGCALLGGETAEHPGLLEPGRFDLAGAALGVVEEGAEVTGAAVEPGDRIVAVASPNVRSNGFSLIRSIVLPRLGLHERLPGTERTVADILLEPSVIYAPAVLAALAAAPVHGLAHITGGGLPGNVIRVLPDGCRARIDSSTWQPPAVFGAIAQLGDVSRDEMLATFNMGVGFVAIVPPDAVATVVGAFEEAGHEAWEAGDIVAADRSVQID